MFFFLQGTFHNVASFLVSWSLQEVVYTKFVFLTHRNDNFKWFNFLHAKAPQIQQKKGLEVDPTACWGGNKSIRQDPRKCAAHSAALQPQSHESSQEPVHGTNLLLSQEAKRTHCWGERMLPAEAFLILSRSSTWARAVGKEVRCPVCKRRAASHGGADTAHLGRPVSEKRNADTPARRRPVQIRCNSDSISENLTLTHHSGASPEWFIFWVF